MAAAAKEAIEHLCNCLAYFGISNLNPEAFRQAKLGNPQVAERFWTGLFQLVVLHLHNFSVRGVQMPSDMNLVKHFVSYMLFKFNCPVPVFPEDSKRLLLALSYTVHFTDLFGQYDCKYALAPVPFSSIEEINAKAVEYLEQHLPKPETLTPFTVLCLYRGLINQIHETFKEVTVSGYMAYALHEIDPSLEVEDLWVANAEERIESFEVQAMNEQNARAKQEKESRMRATFWKWVDAVVDSVDSSETPPKKGPNMPDFGVSIEYICDHLDSLVGEVQFLWREVSSLVSALRAKWQEVNAAITQQFGGSGEWNQILNKVAEDTSKKFVMIENVTERLKSAGNIPMAVSQIVPQQKDRSSGDALLLKKLSKIQSELETLQRTVKSNCVREIRRLPGVKPYNL